MYLAHRIIWLGSYGYFPENEIDHINGIRNDNRLCNLREVSRQCNQRNKNIGIKKISGVKGVCWDKSKNKSKNKWKVQIRINNKTYNIGHFINFDEAVCHRLAVEQCLNWNKCENNSSAYQYVKGEF